MKSSDLNARSNKLQEEYVEKNGLVGKQESKSKLLKNERYKCHRKLSAFFLIYPQRKLMYKEKDYPENLQKYVDTLVNEFGYSLQSTIK